MKTALSALRGRWTLNVYPVQSQSMPLTATTTTTGSTPALHSQAEPILQRARQTLQTEAAAILDLQQHLTHSFTQSVQVMLTVQGRVVVMGMGKSGHIGNKIAATLSSTGTPAMFVHPAEARHGDLGMLKGTDVVLAISNSGETEELIAIVPYIKRLGVVLVAMTGNMQSTLASFADMVLFSGVEKEACPLNLAPTASTTAQLALGDALAVSLLEARGFRAEDFAQSHPGGALGRRLLTLVADVMRSGDKIPTVPPNASIGAVMHEMSGKSTGATAIVDAQGHVLGIFTDGDLRRLVERGSDLRTLQAQHIMHPNPHTIAPDALAVEAVQLMETHRITSILVTNSQQQLLGIVTANDLLLAKVI